MNRPPTPSVARAEIRADELHDATTRARKRITRQFAITRRGDRAIVGIAADGALLAHVWLNLADLDTLADRCRAIADEIRAGAPPEPPRRRLTPELGDVEDRPPRSRPPAGQLPLLD